jgi:hypothetical protein
VSLRYPEPIDRKRLVREILPAALQSPAAVAFAEVLAYPFEQLDSEMEQYVSGTTAEGLAALGSRVGEEPGGLTPPEYRRIIQAARASETARARFDVPSMLGVWRTLTGDAAGTIRTIGPGQIFLRADVTYWPSSLFVARAERLLRRTVQPGIMWGATIAVQGALRFDAQPGLDLGLLSWYLSGEVSG